MNSKILLNASDLQSFHVFPEGLLFVCLMRLHLRGIDILTRALSWLLGPGMQGLPGRAQAILMGAGERLGT